MIARIIVAVIVASVASQAFAASKSVSKVAEPTYFTLAEGLAYE